MIEVAKISGIGEWVTKERKNEHETDVLYLAPNEKVFLVIRPKTIEVRCDGKLGGKSIFWARWGRNCAEWTARGGRVGRFSAVKL